MVGGQARPCLGCARRRRLRKMSVAPGSALVAVEDVLALRDPVGQHTAWSAGSAFSYCARVPGRARLRKAVHEPAVLYNPRLLAGQCERQTAATPHLRKGRPASVSGVLAGASSDARCAEQSGSARPAREHPDQPSRTGVRVVQSSRPAVADIMGARRACTVEMISSMSIP